MVKPRKQYGIPGGPKVVPRSIRINNLRVIPDTNNDEPES